MATQCYNATTRNDANTTTHGVVKATGRDITISWCWSSCHTTLQAREVAIHIMAALFGSDGGCRHRNFILFYIYFLLNSFKREKESEKEKKEREL